MTHRRHDKELDRWLAAEVTADDERADRALTAVLAALPRLGPRAGFAERVAATLFPAAAPVQSWALGWRAATLAALVLGGLSAALLPLVRWLPIERPSYAAIVKTASDAVIDWTLWLGAGLDLWRYMATVGGALRVAATTPEIATALAATALVGAMALYTLHHLLTIERRAWS